MSDGTTLSHAAVEWLIHGEHGLSSEAIFHHLLLGCHGVDRYHYPHDPDDFRRCELLLRAVPELRPLLPRMAGVGPEWAALVSRWDELAELLESECPGAYRGIRSGRAPLCYAAMREAIDGARARP